MLSYLTSQLWPVIAGAVALLAGWLGLKAKAASDRRQGRAEAETAARDATIRKREEMAAVPRPGDGEVSESLREGRF